MGSTSDDRELMEAEEWYDPDPLPMDLHSCAKRGDAEGVRQAVANGENPNCTDRPGYTPLLLGAYNGHLEVVRALLDLGAEIDLADHVGQTALMGVCFRGFPEVAQLLLDRGANVNARNSEQATPLMFAALFGHPDMAELLLRNGADKWATDYRGHTASSLARGQGFDELAKHIEAWGKEPPSRPRSRRRTVR